MEDKKQEVTAIAREVMVLLSSSFPKNSDQVPLVLALIIGALAVKFGKDADIEPRKFLTDNLMPYIEDEATYHLNLGLAKKRQAFCHARTRTRDGSLSAQFRLHARDLLSRTRDGSVVWRVGHIVQLGHGDFSGLWNCNK